MKTVLITGARAPIALEIARSFFQQGHRVIMADSLRFTISRWSNRVNKYYKIPSPRYALNEYISTLQKIIAEEKVEHLIPACEEAIYLASEQHKLACKVWICEADLILKLHNKYTFAQFENEIFPIPKTTLLTDFTDWDSSENYVFKPIYSRFASSVLINKKITQTHFPESTRSKWIAQRKIIGKEICVYSIWDNGVLKAYATYHPLYRAGTGAGVFFEPARHARIFDYVSAFGKKLNYTGQLSFDVIIDDNDTPYFIECNPRGTSGAHLIHDKIAMSYLGDEMYIFEKDQEYSLKYAMLVLHPKVFFNRRTRKSKDVIYCAEDIFPFFMQLFALLEVTVIKYIKCLTWLEATTADIEWNGDED